MSTSEAPTNSELLDQRMKLLEERSASLQQKLEELYTENARKLNKTDLVDKLNSLDKLGERLERVDRTLGSFNQEIEQLKRQNSTANNPQLSTQFSSLKSDLDAVRLAIGPMQTKLASLSNANNNVGTVPESVVKDAVNREISGLTISHATFTTSVNTQLSSLRNDVNKLADSVSNIKYQPQPAIQTQQPQSVVLQTQPVVQTQPAQSNVPSQPTHAPPRMASSGPDPRLRNNLQQSNNNQRQTQSTGRPFTQPSSSYNSSINNSSVNNTSTGTQVQQTTHVPKTTVGKRPYTARSR